MAATSFVEEGSMLATSLPGLTCQHAGVLSLPILKSYAVLKSSSSASCLSDVPVCIHACVEYVEGANVAETVLLCSVVCKHNSLLIHHCQYQPCCPQS